MNLSAQYADGRAALFRTVPVELSEDGLIVVDGERRIPWSYREIRRADDGNGRIILKRKPDLGERLSFDLEAREWLASFAPALFKPRAQGVEGLPVVGGLIIGAWSAAAAFLLGIPLLADPIADIMPPRVRTQIADMSWQHVNAMSDMCDDSDAAEAVLNRVAYRIMEQSDVAMRDEIWITIVSSGLPNAFALPDQTIIVTDELIAMAEHPDEITGVIAHEIAHIEHEHILKGLIRSMGAGIFFDIVFGGAGAGQAVAIASVNLSSLRFSRDDETDADLRGLQYLEASGISSAGLGQLFERMETYIRDQGGSIPTLLSSHPDSHERADAARARARTGLAPSMTEEEWRIVRSACGRTHEEPAAQQTPAAPAAPAESTPTEPTPEKRP
jgi:predicted Zn-dependent protease